MSTKLRSAFRAVLCLSVVCLATGRLGSRQEEACQDDDLPDETNGCSLPPSFTCDDVLAGYDVNACDMHWFDTVFCPGGTVEDPGKVRDQCRKTCGDCPDSGSGSGSASGGSSGSGNSVVTWNRKVCCKEGIKNWRFCKLQRFMDDDHGDVCRNNDWPKNRNWRCPKGCFKVMDGPTNGWADKPFCVGKDKKACRV